jgi:hypothetical protein
MPDPDERGRAYEAMRAHADADAARRPGRAAGAALRPDEKDQTRVTRQPAERAGRRPDPAQQPAEQAGRRGGEADRRADDTGDQAEETQQRAERPGERPDGNGGRGYWAEVPRFRLMWADHVRRWPDVRRPAAADRADDPPGSHRGAGGDIPERRAEAAGAIGRIREAEPGISADARAIARENTCGAWLEGFEHRLKGEDRLKEKVAEGLATATPDATPEQVLRLIPDAIRYTFCLRPEDYARGYHEIRARLENFGYQMYESRTFWANPEYKGINTRWVTADGQRFEVQFHTPESFHAKHHVTHAAYERMRNLVTSKRELRELHAFQRAVSAHVQIPDGAADIPDYKKEGLRWQAR